MCITLGVCIGVWLTVGICIDLGVWKEVGKKFFSSIKPSLLDRGEGEWRGVEKGGDPGSLKSDEFIRVTVKTAWVTGRNRAEEGRDRDR